MSPQQSGIKETNMNKLLLILAGIIVLQGCATSPLVSGDYVNTELIDYPEAGINITAGLGETLVRKGIRQTGSAIIIDRPLRFGNLSFLGCSPVVEPGSFFQNSVYQRSGNTTMFGDTPVPSPRNGAACYAVGLARNVNDDGRSDFVCSGQTISGPSVCYSEVGDNYFLVGNGNQISELPQQNVGGIRREQRSVQRQTNFVQELIYNGRVDNNLRFIYREFSNDLVRPAFTQEVQYDTNESNIIGFRDLRIEVISATNTEIVYKLISNFN